MNIETSIAPLLDLLAKSAALILLGSALIAVLRKSSAANRHAISVAIFAGLMLLPFTKLLPARWSFAIEKPAAPGLNVRLPLILPATSSETEKSASPAADTSAAASTAPLVIPWKKLAIFVWLGGAALLIAGRAIIALRLRSIVRRSFPIEDAPLAATVRGLVATSEVPAEVRMSDECRVPLAAGIVRPVVLLPAEATDWSDVSISSALRHELGHVRRRDCITRLIADVLCALYWVNPLVWFAARQMRLAQEQACDDLVLNAGASASEYAEQLVDVVRNLQGNRFTARHALAMAQPSTLETRVLAIVDAQRDRSARSIRGTYVGLAFVGASLALCTAAQLRGADEKKAGADADANRAARKQILIEAKFVEITGDNPALVKIMKEYNSTVSTVGVLTKDKAGEVLRALNQPKGVDLLSAPRITTLTNQAARIEVVRDLKYPTEWEKNPKTGILEPTVYDTKDVGVKLGVVTGTNADGSITLKLEPEVVEFEGFEDLDAKTKTRIGKADDKLPANKRLVTLPDLSKIPEGHRTRPIFNVRKMEANVTIQPEQTVILGGMEKVDVQTVEDTNSKTGRTKVSGVQLRRRLFVLVTARIVKPDGVPAARPGGASSNPAGKTGAILEAKPLEIASDKMSLDTKTGVLSASGNVKIETAEATIAAAAVEITPKNNDGNKRATEATTDAGQPTPQWVFPKLDFREATVREIVDFLVAKSKTLDAAGHGANIILKDAAKIGDVRVTLSLKNIPLAEVLRYVAALANCELVNEEFAFILRPMPEGKAPAPNAAPEKEAPKPAAAPEQPKSAALKKAGAIIIPKLELRDATLSETVEFLRAKAKELDPEKRGVNLVLKPAADGKDPKITLSLANIPIVEALRYVAALSGFELVADEHVITIQPAAK